MARPPSPAIRESLTERAVQYVIAHGVTDLSLRPLAKALGTNARMLVYHFGSREGLMRAILIGLRAHEDAQIDAWFRSGRRPRTAVEFVRWYWRRVSTPEARSAVLLIFELYALALRDPKSYPGVLEDPIAKWELQLERTGVAPDRGRETTATLLLAVTRGLLLDLAATGDRARVGRALATMLELLERADESSR